MTRFFAPLVALFATACAPAMLQTARTNGEGNFQFAVEPGFTGVASDGAVVGLPMLNFSGRYGVTDSIDFGLRLGTSIYELQSKFMLTDPAALDSVALALAPSTTIFGAGGSAGGVGAGAFYWTTRVPLLIGVPVGRSELTIGPRVTPTVARLSGSGAGTTASTTGFFLQAGATVGYAARLADKFRLMPEFGIDVPLVATGVSSVNGNSTGSSADVAFAGLGFNVSLGFLFGGSDI